MVIFNRLTTGDLKEIVKIQIEEVVDRLKVKDIGFKISNDALFLLAQQGFSPQYGARPLKRLIQNKILNTVAELIISDNISKGDLVSVKVKNNELAVEGVSKKKPKKRTKNKVKVA